MSTTTDLADVLITELQLSICAFPYFKDIAELQNHESSGIEQQRFTKLSISLT